MATGAIIARIVSEYSDKGTKAATKDLQSVGKEFDAFGGKVKKAFEVAAVASAAFAIKIGIDSVKAALADQKSQALLASSLKNTTGANQAAIKSADDYIKKTMLRLGVTDDELRPSLAALATATHSVTEAEKLQGLALDISAGRNKDLTQVSIALAKAYDGNFTAVKRLGIPISEALIKSKDFTGILKELSAAVGGQATVAADTLAGRMDRVKLAFDEAKKSLGYALMPVIQDFLSTLTDQVLPKLQLWIDANKDKLAAGLKTAATALGSLLKNGIAFGEWITSHMTLVKDFAAVIAIMWTTTKVAAFVGAINTVITAMRLLTATSVATSIAEAFATGGVSVAAGTIAAVTLTAAYATYNVATNWSKVKDKTDAAAASANDYYSRSKAAVVGQAVADAAAKRIADQKAKDDKAAAIAAASAAAAAAKTAADKLKTEQAAAALKKMGIVATDPALMTAIELEAARQNQVKQGNLLEQAKLQAMLDQWNLQMKNNEAAQKYADIMQALADNQISTQEVAVLADKWGMTSTQVMVYIDRIYAANSTPANNDSILALYQAWGLTKDQAQKYIDFAVALKDQKLDDTEINNLRTKWGMTRQQVIDYAAQVQAGTAFSTTFSDPGNLAAASWIDALNSFNAYMKAIGGKQSGGGGGSAYQQAVAAATNSNANKAKLAGVDILGGTFSGTPSAVTDAINAAALSNAMQYNPLGGLQATTADISATSAYNPLSGMTASYGAGAGSSSSSSAGGTTIINVSGSLITQADLTSSVRNNLLQGQLSGKAVTFSVAAI